VESSLSRSFRRNRRPRERRKEKNNKRSLKPETSSDRRFCGGSTVRSESLQKGRQEVGEEGCTCLKKKENEGVVGPGEHHPTPPNTEGKKGKARTSYILLAKQHRKKKKRGRKGLFRPERTLPL